MNRKDEEKPDFRAVRGVSGAAQAGEAAEGVSAGQVSGEVVIEGEKLHYEVMGEGLAVVFIHGNMLDRRMWRFNVGELANSCRVVVYDMRGFGLSGRRSLQFGAAVRDLRALLDHLSIDTAVVCGASMGGVVATHFALEYAHRCAGLILVDSDLSGFPISAEFAEPILRTHELLEGGDTKAAERLWLEHPMLASVRALAGAGELLEEMIGDYGWADWLKGRAYLLDPPAIKRLSDISSPTLIITGENDLGRFGAIAEQFERAIPRARWEVVRGVGHLPNMERPGEFNFIVGEFLKELKSGDK